MPLRIPFARDEAVWFLRSVEQNVVRFRECPADCFGFRKYGVAGPITSTRQPANLATCSPSPAQKPPG